jgi:hypothetical protein
MRAVPRERIVGAELGSLGKHLRVPTAHPLLCFGWRQCQRELGLVAGFLLQHAVQGWCPALPIVRALGFRTSREIDAERSALKAGRGDFDALDALDAARAAGPNTLLTVAEF